MLDRGAEPEEAAGAIYLFCRPEADFITGQVITASGGMMG
jgi:3-oxoacyl-[acyl-carrier protein] reductase